MEQSHFSLTWEKFHSSMCAGFSLLQQDGELVDLTLAADGHLVKVHQVVLGVASPYLKSLILSANCKHPVIFLNNISYAILRSILEYVYTGEVSIEEKDLKVFLQTARNLQIRGLGEEMTAVEKSVKESKSSVFELPETAPAKRFTLETLANKQVKVTEHVPLPSTARNVSLITTPQTPKVTPKKSDPLHFEEMLSDDNDDHWSDGMSPTNEDRTSMDSEQKCTKVIEKKVKEKSKDQDILESRNAEMKFTVSNQGSLQLILNRYIYSLKNYKPQHGTLRRWYCADAAARFRCPAVVVTENNVVVRRTRLHNHPFHDKRIQAKMERKAIYTAIQAAQSAVKDED